MNHVPQISRWQLMDSILNRHTAIWCLQMFCVVNIYEIFYLQLIKRKTISRCIVFRFSPNFLKSSKNVNFLTFSQIFIENFSIKFLKFINFTRVYSKLSRILL